MDSVFGELDPQSVLEVVGNYIGIDVNASENHLTMSNTKKRMAQRALLDEYDLPLFDVNTPLLPNARELMYASVSAENPAVTMVNETRVVECGSWLAVTAAPLLPPGTCGSVVV